MAAWSRIGRGAQVSLSQSLSRIVSEGGGASPAEVASALRGAAALSRARGQHASSLHSLARGGLAGRGAFAGAGGRLLEPASRGIGTTPARMHPESAAAAESELSDAEAREPKAAAAPTPTRRMPGLSPTRPGEKPRLVVLGTGWAACRLLKDVNTRAYDVVCVSPRNHMVFTPLLASTCVGTLEFRSVVEPVSRIQSALATNPGSYFYLANCTGIDAKAHEVYCTAAASDGRLPSDPYHFKIAYDKLVIASGAEPLTFNIKGVEENAIFLREVSHAQEIRRKLLTNLMLSENPGLSEEEKKRLLHCVVVGGGPTGVEFSGELSDFITRDVRERYAHVKDYVKVTLIEANEILSSFDIGLRQYATNHLSKYGVKLVRGIVKDVNPTEITLSDGTSVPYGLLVWSTGVGPSEFVKSLDLPKSPGGRIGVDEWLRVPSVPDVFALGDCAGFLEGTGKPVLPALAQVAEREGRYMARLLGRIAAQNGGGKAHCAGKADLGEPFVYKHIGSMASVGRYKALVDLRENKDAKGVSMAGFLSWVMWRSAYLTRVVSWRNRFYVAVNWATTLVFGRDNTRIG
ncbi:hypothetical protein U9M48_015599 [Paspalum notatum var. saurae]|uniref:NADH:ubiquinone reductase (non-electrogenic) n=1 Tax=Paspalum notatum var. saurae TaxID=547442 RepID=A0AAQ3T3F7_PASNO